MNLLDFWMGMTGVVLPFAGTSAPSGWMLCYGQSLLRADYPRLFATIGTTYGAADGTHFNLPDLRGRLAAGKDDMGGSAANTLNITQTGTRGSTGNGIITGLSSTASMTVGMKAFGTGIGTNATIASIDSSTQVTLSVNNSATGTASIRFGVVDGATLGATGGAQTHAITSGQLATHHHPLYVQSGGNFTNGGSTTYATSSGGSNGTNVDTLDLGQGHAHTNVQPTMVLNHIIKD